MRNPKARMCVLLPCGGDLRWAVPQSCLTEIHTVAADSDDPPATVNWRGLDLPVVDVGARSGTPWRDSRSGTGLVVIIPGVSGHGSDYWALALRGAGLAVRDVQEVDCDDLPDSLVEHSVAAFALGGVVYQVPDLASLERLSATLDTAQTA